VKLLVLQSVRPQGSQLVKSDPVDSTMYEAQGGSTQEAPWEQHHGPTILNGAPVASVVNLLHLIASLFPAGEGEDSCQQLAEAAAKEDGYAPHSPHPSYETQMFIIRSQAKSVE
jgi:hypothetical protein